MKTHIGILTVALSLAAGSAGADETRPAPPNPAKPLTPEQAPRKTNETCTVAFKVETVARVKDITERGTQKPLEILLVDTRNDDQQTTPTERASIIVRIPDSACERFGARTLDELARRFERRTVIVTGRVEVEPHPFRRDSQGRNLPRARITVTKPKQIVVEAPR